MKPLTPLQRESLVRRVEREYMWSRASISDRDFAHVLAGRIVDGIAWVGEHGASEKRAVELIVNNIDEASA